MKAKVWLDKVEVLVPGKRHYRKVRGQHSVRFDGS